MFVVLALDVGAQSNLGRKALRFKCVRMKSALQSAALDTCNCGKSSDWESSQLDFRLIKCMFVPECTAQREEQGARWGGTS